MLIIAIVGALLLARWIRLCYLKPSQFPQVTSDVFSEWVRLEKRAARFCVCATLVPLFVLFAFGVLVDAMKLAPYMAERVGTYVMTPVFVGWLVSMVFGIVLWERARRQRRALGIEWK